MKLSKQFAALAVLLLLPVMASADWERSISAWDTRLPNKGKIQAAFWGSSFKSEVSNRDFTDKSGTLSLNYGISDKWEASVAPSFYSWKLDGGGSESGVSDTILQTTYRFRDEAADNFDLAVMGNLSLPTGDDKKDLGNGNYEPGASLLGSKKFGAVVAVANLGLKANLDPQKGDNTFILESTVEGIYPLTDKLSLNAAASVFTASADGGDTLVDLGLGTRYNVTGKMFVGGILYKCITDAYDWGVMLAAGIEF